ncbi:hypothetical protein N9M21_01530 [Alphaproteobacteria bacterium]|nr:hypothetical protein [Alphaproteobacteria bacterium]
MLGNVDPQLGSARAYGVKNPLLRCFCRLNINLSGLWHAHIDQNSRCCASDGVDFGGAVGHDGPCRYRIQRVSDEVHGHRIGDAVDQRALGLQSR